MTQIKAALPSSRRRGARLASLLTSLALAAAAPGQGLVADVNIIHMCFFQSHGVAIVELMSRVQLRGAGG